MWGLRKYFDDESFITYDDIIKAEKELTGTEFGNLNLTKPHPFMFLKGILGKNYPTKSIIKGIYNKEEIAKTLIVGDAGADIIAAQSINCKFAAVLTGYGGKQSKNFSATRSRYNN